MSKEEHQDGKSRPAEKIEASVLDENKPYREGQYSRVVISIGLFVLVAWILGKCGFSFYWLLGLLLLVYTWWRGKIDPLLELVCRQADAEARRERAFKNAETVEWLNFILNRWLVLSDESLLLMIKNSLDPLLESCLPPFIASIEVNDFTLGTHTPFIKYVEAYDNFDDLRKLRATALSMRSPPDDLLTRPKYKAVLDLDIGLASPEARFVIRIRLGNKGILGTETDIAIEDFQISGRMQLVFSFNRNIAFPHLASISFCFLEEPQVSFNIRMLKAVQLMDFPLVRQWVTQLVNDTLKLSLVDPDRIYIPLCEDPDDAGRGADCACGALTLKITGGVQGRPTDDTYWCVVSLGDQKYSTKEISSEGPWSDHVTILVYNLHYDKVIVKVKGKRKLGTKYTVFQDTTALARLYLDSNPIQEKCFEKEGLRGSSMKMEMEYTPLPVVTIPSEEDSEQFEELAVSTSQRLRTDPDEVSGVLLVCMHGGESMIPMDKNGLSDPYCVVYANRNLVKKTEVAKETLDPVWNAMVEFPVANFTQVTLSFAVFDKDDAIDDFLGSCNFKLTKETCVVFRKNLSILYKTKSSSIKKSGKICISVVFRPVVTVRKSGKPELPGGFPEGEPPDEKSGKSDARALELLLMSERGAIQVSVLRGRNLVAMDITGKSDPFVTFRVGDQEKFRSRVHQKTLNPVWMESVALSLPADDDKLYLDVWDKDALSQERMGSVTFNPNTLKELAKDPSAQQWFKLNNTKSGEVQLAFRYTPPEECNIDELSNSFSAGEVAEEFVGQLEDHEFAELTKSRKSGWKTMLKKRRGVFGISSRISKKSSPNPQITLQQPTHDSLEDDGTQSPKTQSLKPQSTKPQSPKPQSPNIHRRGSPANKGKSSRPITPRKGSHFTSSGKGSRHSSHDEDDSSGTPRKNSGRSLPDRDDYWLADDEGQGDSPVSKTPKTTLVANGKSPSNKRNRKGSLKCIGGFSDQTDADFSYLPVQDSPSPKPRKESRWKMKNLKAKPKRQGSVSESEVDSAVLEESRDLLDAWFDQEETESADRAKSKKTSVKHPKS